MLVTDDPSRRRLANQEGFRTRRGLRTLKHLMLGTGPESAALRRCPTGCRCPRFDVFFSLLGLLIVAGWPSLASTRRCTSHSCRRRAPINQTVDITVDPDAKAADASTATLPATRHERARRRLRQRCQIPSDRTIGSDKAHGEAIVTSQRPAAFKSAQGLDRARGRRPEVHDRSGRSICRHACRSASGITAVDPGTGGNVGAGTITRFDGGGFDQLQVTNQRPTTGGTDRQAKVVSEDDRKALDDQLRKSARDKGFASCSRKPGRSRPCPNRP